MVKCFNSSKSYYCLVTSKKPLGFGIIIEFNPVYADREKVFVFEVMAVWIKFWWVRYKKGRS